MKHVRTAVALAAVGALLASGAASAATKAKPLCNLVADAAGDAAPTLKDVIFPIEFTPAPIPPVQAPAGFPNVPLGSSTDALDVLSADLAANKKHITAVIRLKKLASTAPTAAPSGMRWKFFWVADEVVFSMGAHADPTGAITFDAAYVDTLGRGNLYAGGVTGSFDTAKSEIHLSASPSLFAQANIKVGSKLSKLNVLTGVEAAISDKTGRVTSGAIYRTYPVTHDTADTAKTYVVGTSSCVTPGK